ncbi:hypothetical protein STEG23_015218 [Scotinomys teguina]
MNTGYYAFTVSTSSFFTMVLLDHVHSSHETLGAVPGKSTLVTACGEGFYGTGGAIVAAFLGARKWYWNWESGSFPIKSPMQCNVPPVECALEQCATTTNQSLTNGFNAGPSPESFYTVTTPNPSLTQILIVMVILGCQLDYIWSELQTRNGEHTCDLDLEAGRQYAFDPDLEVDNIHL